MSSDPQQPATQENEAAQQAGPEPGSPRKTVKHVVIVLVVLIIAGFGIATSLHMVPAGHSGVIMRLGRFAGTSGPGLHAVLPFGIERVEYIDTQRVETEAFGFRNVKAGTGKRTRKNPESMKESSMITGDLNIIDLQWVVQYRREDPMKYFKSFHDPVQSVRDASESVVRGVIGDHSFDYVVRNRDEIGRMCREDLQKILNAYGSGIRVVSVRIQDISPPDAVRNAFDEVIAAQQEKERLINDAQEAYNREIPKARGESAGVVSKAQGYALERVNRAKGETSRFNEVLREYRTSREVTKKRLYLETCREVMPKAGRIFVIDGKQKNVVPMLNLDRLGSEKGGGK